MAIMEKEKVKCTECDKYFRDRFNSWRHYLRIHYKPKKDGTNNETKAEKTKPVCSHCGHIFYKRGNLKRHSNLCKKKKSNTSSCEEYSFKDISEFEEWKHKIETGTNARFVRKSHYKLQTGSFRTKYSCHRSGFYKSQSNNVRRLKSLGSNKINAICPAKIITIVNSEGKVEVSFFPKHYGHAMELERITLNKAERAQIAKKINMKMSFKEILNNLKNSSEFDLKRLSLLTKKDIRNIKKEFKINNNTSYSYDNIDYFLNDHPDILDNHVEQLEFISRQASLELVSLQHEAIDVFIPPHEGLAESPEDQPSSEVLQSAVISAAKVHQSGLIGVGDSMLSPAEVLQCVLISAAEGQKSGVIGCPEAAQPEMEQAANMSTPGVLEQSDMISSSEVQSSLLTSTSDEQQLAVSTPGSQNPTFLIEVPYSVSLRGSSYMDDLSSSENLNYIESLKNDIRKEFELVLSTIKNEEQAQNGKKWVNAFHSFVHSINFPLPLDGSD